MKIPENDVTIHRNDAGGVEMLVDGHDIAPNVSSWRVDDQGADAPLLTVTIPCTRLRMDVGYVNPPPPVHITNRPIDAVGSTGASWPAR